jgi:hypothetical protein
MRFSKSLCGAGLRTGATDFFAAFLAGFLLAFLGADRAGTFLAFFVALTLAAGFFAVLDAALRVRAWDPLRSGNRI